MNFIKKMCILRQVKQGFSGDGRTLSGLVKLEQYGKNLAVEVSVINFAPLASGEYYCLVADPAGRTEMLPLRGKSIFNIISELNASQGFCAVVCFVKNGIVPIAYGVNGGAVYDWRALVRRSVPESAKKTKGANADGRGAKDTDKNADGRETAFSVFPRPLADEAPPFGVPSDDLPFPLAATEEENKTEDGSRAETNDKTERDRCIDGSSNERAKDRATETPPPESAPEEGFFKEYPTAKRDECLPPTAVEREPPEKEKTPPQAEKTEGYDDEKVAAENYYHRKEQEDERIAHEKSDTYAHAESKDQSGTEKERTNAETDGDAERLCRPFATDADGYYLSVKAEIDALFAQYPQDQRLSGVFPASEWVRIEDEIRGEYLVGVVYEELKARYICYAIPADNPASPPEEIASVCTFVPLSAFSDKEGCFVIFQSCATGECVRAESL